MGAFDIQPGSTGYFLPLRQELDPRLFDGQRIKPEIRKGILDTLYRWWERRYNNPRYWSEVWLAGSGVSYQWREGEDGDIDLDCLIGVDSAKFFEANESYMGTPFDSIAQKINQDFYDGLDHDTAHFMGDFELTFYVNPGATNITAINPYAAYDLTTDSWTVRPPTDPFAPPGAWVATGQAEVARVSDMVKSYADVVHSMSDVVPGGPGWVNRVNQRRSLGSQLSALFNEIHEGRRRAFSAMGRGYRDWNEFRYKLHKTMGTFGALHTIAHNEV